MPKLSGLFGNFDNLDQILPEDVACWLKPVPQHAQIEDYIANKILYPQTVPVTIADMQLELGLLREAVKLNGPKAGLQQNALLGENPFLNITLRKILIPAKFLNFVPNLSVLTQVFIDALLIDRKKEDWFEDLWTVVLTDDIDEVVGSVLIAQFSGNGGVIDINLLGKNYEIAQGGLTAIPCPKDRCEISYKLRNGLILGKNESAIEVYGGKLGVIVDARSK